jgi:hypothetical protein
MKMISLRRVAPVLAAALGAAACNDGLTDINVDPNRPLTSPAPYLLTQAQASAVDRGLGDNFNLTLTGLWAQHYAKIQYVDEDKYDLRPQQIDAHFTGFYAGPLRDLAEVMRQGTEQAKPNYTAIGDIMSVWTWHLMTDVWGDIPYSEALMGSLSDGNNVTPVYDTQQSIYTSLLARLATSQAALTAGGGDFGDADLIYQGDPTLWRRFANSMRLRLALRMSSVPASAAAARAAFEAAAAQPLIVETEHSATLDYGTGNDDANPIYLNRYLDERVDHAVSKTLVDMLIALDDPRLAIYAAPTEAHGDFVGQPNGSDEPVQFDERSMVGDFFLSADTKGYLFTAAETYFLLAEAKVLGWNVPASYGTAEEIYRQGVRLSMEEFGVEEADIAAYLTTAAGTLGATAAEQLAEIRTQKWLALYSNGPEAYAEFRRTHTPLLAPAVDGINGGRIPVRVPYPTIEQSLNNTNLQVAVGRNGGLTLNDRVWWDVAAVVYPSN